MLNVYVEMYVERYVERYVLFELLLGFNTC